MQIDFHELELSAQPLGEGSYGVVYKGHFRGTPVAVKLLKVNQSKVVQQKLEEEFLKEVKMLRYAFMKHIPTPAMCVAHLRQRAAAPEHHPLYGCLHDAALCPRDGVHGARQSLRVPRQQVRFLSPNCTDTWPRAHPTRPI